MISATKSEIPAYTRCTLTNVRVFGNVRLREGSGLVASYLTVYGRVEANAAQELSLADSRIIGEVQAEKGRNVTIRNTFVARKVELKSNRGAIAMADNTVLEMLRLEDNRIGPFSLVRNTSQALECKDNDPAPVGGGNVASQKSGQCSGL